MWVLLVAQPLRCVSTGQACRPAVWRSWRRSSSTHWAGTLLQNHLVRAPPKFPFTSVHVPTMHAIDYSGMLVALLPWL